MGEFEFVVSNGAPQRASKVARSHAVKSGLQRKGTRPSPTNKNNSQLTIRKKSELKGRFRLSITEKSESTPWMSSKSPAESSPPSKPKPAGGSLPQGEHGKKEQDQKPRVEVLRAPSQSSSDPFQTLPIQQTPNVDRLIKHLLQYLELDISAAQITKAWWGLAMTDPLVMHTTLGVVAVEWGMMVPDPRAAFHEGAKQKALALTGVQDRLQKNDTGGAVVGAIANLASMEGLCGDYHAAMIHLKAIDAIVKGRGGWNSFFCSKKFSTSINWPDVVVAVGTGSAPMLRLIHDWDSISLPSSIICAAETPSLSHLKAFESDTEDTTIRYLFAMLRQAMYASLSEEIPSQHRRIIFNSVDHRVATLLHQTEDPVRRVLLSAAQLFIVSVVRDVHVWCTFPDILSQRLMDYLEGRIDNLLLDETHRCGLLWCFFTFFTCVRPESNQRLFFKNALLKTFKVMGITKSKHVEVILQQYLWNEERYGRSLMEYSFVLFP